VFGSVARDTPDDGSDLDLLVDLRLVALCWTWWLWSEI
jgi:predicted nucleotidyltransferase